MKLADALYTLQKATCPEEVFGDLNGNQNKVFNEWRRLTHPDLNPKNQKDAETAFALVTEWIKRAETKIEKGTYGQPNIFHKPILITTKNGVYSVTEKIGSGDLSEVYAGSRNSQPTALKIPRNPKNNDLIRNEGNTLDFLQASAPTRELEAMVHLPKLLDRFELKQSHVVKAVNVFEPLIGYHHLGQVIRRYPDGLDIRDAAWMFNRILGALLIAHQAGIVHGAVMPKHVMIKPETDHNGVLIDWCYATKIGQKLKAVVPKFAYYPPQVFENKIATKSVDVYMAAMCFLMLVGGDNPPSLTALLPKLPRNNAGVIRACLVRNGTNDVWELFNDFNDALKANYGQPKYRPFTM